MFKVGQKVFSVTKGWGEVSQVQNSNAPENYVINVIYPNGSNDDYLTDGRYHKSEKFPEIYPDKPEWFPKQRVEHKGWIAVGNSAGTTGHFLSPIIYFSKELLTSTCDYDWGLYTPQEITFYTEN